MLESACVQSYTSAVGYRARQAVLHGDVEIFDALMAEAAEEKPPSPLEDPKRTVLTHFLDFGGSDRFLPMIEAWRAKGWVSSFMDCAIHRARYRGTIARDPQEADRAASVCLDRAREGAIDPELRWRLEACLAGAPFLTASSTVALSKYEAIAVDSAEPYLFRAAILDGLSTVFVRDPAALRASDPALTSEAAVARSRAELDRVAARFEAILRGVRGDSDPALIAAATAIGALELERVSIAHGESLVARHAVSRDAEERALAWGWVRAAKVKPRVDRLDSLGLWDRSREPAGDAFWYLCQGDGGEAARGEGPAGDLASQPRSSQTGADVSGVRERAEAIVVLARSALADAAASLRARCVSEKTGAPLARITGPFPLEATAKASAGVRSARRIFLEPGFETKSETKSVENGPSLH